MKAEKDVQPCCCPSCGHCTKVATPYWPVPYYPVPYYPRPYTYGPIWYGSDTARQQQGDIGTTGYTANSSKPPPSTPHIIG